MKNELSSKDTLEEKSGTLLLFSTTSVTYSEIFRFSCFSCKSQIHKILYYFPHVLYTTLEYNHPLKMNSRKRSQVCTTVQGNNQWGSKFTNIIQLNTKRDETKVFQTHNVFMSFLISFVALFCFSTRFCRFTLVADLYHAGQVADLKTKHLLLCDPFPIFVPQSTMNMLSVPDGAP